jgi:hypothetical protein
VLLTKLKQSFDKWHVWFYSRVCRTFAIGLTFESIFSYFTPIIGTVRDFSELLSLCQCHADHKAPKGNFGRGSG